MNSATLLPSAQPTQKLFVVCFPNEDKELAFNTLEKALHAIKEHYKPYDTDNAIGAKLQGFVDGCMHAPNPAVGALFVATCLDGRTHVGWHFAKAGTKAGDRFHYDHGIGIDKNQDGFYLLVAESI